MLSNNIIEIASNVTNIAAVKGGIDVLDKLEPVLNLLNSVSKPCAIGMVIFGFLKIMLSDSVSGKKVIKNSIYGYIGIQAVPIIFDIIDSIF